MKVTDYIIEFLISKGVTDLFGYPGGVVCHLIDSASKYSDKIRIHINYHEQAAAFSACGYAQECGKLGVAFATSGPGATNLVTGIANAYFDSIPTMFLTGQVDTYGLKDGMAIRQRGFQETDVVSMVRCVTKYAVRIDRPEDVCEEFAKAYACAVQGNPGPVLIDLPADVQRAEIDLSKNVKTQTEQSCDDTATLQMMAAQVCDAISAAKRPCLLVGNGVKLAGQTKILQALVTETKIPTVFSMPAFDVLPYSHEANFGFIGANGHRYANFVLGKSDLIVSIGSRLDLKQVGNDREAFAPDARLIRVDIDPDSFKNPVHADEIALKADLKTFLPELFSLARGRVMCSPEWFSACEKVRDKLRGYDDEDYTVLLREFCKTIPSDAVITADVGQSQVWLAQQLCVKEGQSVHMSCGHGAMGYSLPAAIGAYYADPKVVYSFNGDGGIQMNLQELQYLARERIPVHVVVINNRSLGMIRGFQEANFNGNYQCTTEGTGYSAPDFSGLASAYGLQYACVRDFDDIKKLSLDMGAPSLTEIMISTETVLNPNFGRNGKIQDQRPYIDRALYDELMNL